MFSVLRMICVVALVLSSNAAANAAPDGYWTITGIIENVDAGVSGTNRCQIANLELRFKSRWSNGLGCTTGFNGECPWGTAWGQTRTNSSGQFSIRSNRFVDQGRKRDVLIEYRSMGSWLSLKTVSGIDSNTPRLTQGNNWTFSLGTVMTDKLDCPTVLTDAPEAPKELVPTSAQNGGGKGAGPCGNIDLEIVSVAIRRRTANGNEYSPRYIEWEVTIRNNGTSAYAGTGKCKTKVALDLYVNSNVRSYSVSMTNPIPAGGTAVFSSPTQGYFGSQSSLNASYGVLFTVDSQNELQETNEQNNRRPGCYSLATEEYSDGPCTSQRRSQADNSKRSSELRPNPSYRNSKSVLVRNRHHARSRPK